MESKIYFLNLHCSNKAAYDDVAFNDETFFYQALKMYINIWIDLSAKISVFKYKELLFIVSAKMSISVHPYYYLFIFFPSGA